MSDHIDGGERRCITLDAEQNRIVERSDPHPPHDWEWKPDHGPQVVTVYHCPGVTPERQAIR